MHLRPIFQGIAISLGGAAVWLFLYLSRMYRASDSLLVVTICTIFGLLISCVYVVPLGAALGVVVPYCCCHKPIVLSVTAAAFIGCIVAGLTSLIVAVVFELHLASVFRSMVPVTVLLIVAWSFFLRREKSGLAQSQT